MGTQKKSFFCIKEIQKRLDKIEEVLPQVEETLQKMQSKLKISVKSSPSDLVTNADLESEKILLHAIAKHFSRDAVISEESEAPAEVPKKKIYEEAMRREDFCWVLDPLDGTMNYAHRMPLYAVSIGLLHQGEPVGGVVSLPAFKTVYRAALGEGAVKNGSPIKVSDNYELSTALIAVGFPYTCEDSLEGLLSALGNAALKCRGTRHTGSSALSMCWLAEGIFTAHYEIGLKPWDTAAGLALVREAGGKVSDFSGRPYTLGMYEMAASNGHLHEKLLEIIQSLRRKNKT